MNSRINKNSNGNKKATTKMSKTTIASTVRKMTAEAKKCYNTKNNSMNGKGQQPKKKTANSSNDKHNCRNEKSSIK